ncbi:MAG: hypothetical protein ACJ76F_11540 [Bacteroidia bacterium]
MKKQKLMIVMMGIVATAFISSCQSPEKKVEKAEEKVEDAKMDLTQAQIDARNENFKAWQKFRNESEDRIRENEKMIGEQKAKLKNTNNKAGNDPRLDEMERKNSELRQKIYNYDNADDSKWEEFKREFNHDMDELGKSLKDFTVDNKK